MHVTPNADVSQSLICHSFAKDTRLAWVLFSWDQAENVVVLLEGFQGILS